NRKLAVALTKLGAAKLDFRFIQIDDLPLYNLDIAPETVPAVARLKSEVAAADGLLFVTPEHNRSIPAVLKNAIDWGSKPMPENVWNGRVAAITGTSPGAIGTAIAQQHLRQILATIGVLVMGGEAYVSFPTCQIDDQGNIGNEGSRTFLQGYLD